LVISNFFQKLKKKKTNIFSFLFLSLKNDDFLKMMYLMEREWREVDESRGGGRAESSRRGTPVCVSVCYKHKTFAAGGLLQEEERKKEKNPWPSVLGGLPSFFFLLYLLSHLSVSFSSFFL
jgi:hypothetical protein